MMMVQLVSGVKFVVTDRISVDVVETDVNLKGPYRIQPPTVLSHFSRACSVYILLATIQSSVRVAICPTFKTLGLLEQD